MQGILDNHLIRCRIGVRHLDILESAADAASHIRFLPDARGVFQFITVQVRGITDLDGTVGGNHILYRSSSQIQQTFTTRIQDIVFDGAQLGLCDLLAQSGHFQGTANRNLNCVYPGFEIEIIAEQNRFASFQHTLISDQNAAGAGYIRLIRQDGVHGQFAVSARAAHRERAAALVQAVHGQAAVVHGHRARVLDQRRQGQVGLGGVAAHGQSGGAHAFRGCGRVHGQAVHAVQRAAGQGQAMEGQLAVRTAVISDRTAGQGRIHPARGEIQLALVGHGNSAAGKVERAARGHIRESGVYDAALLGFPGHGQDACHLDGTAAHIGFAGQDVAGLVRVYRNAGVVADIQGHKVRASIRGRGIEHGIRAVHDDLGIAGKIHLAAFAGFPGLNTGKEHTGIAQGHRAAGNIGPAFVVHAVAAQPGAVVPGCHGTTPVKADFNRAAADFQIAHLHVAVELTVTAVVNGGVALDHKFAAGKAVAATGVGEAIHRAVRAAVGLFRPERAVDGQRAAFLVDLGIGSVERAALRHGHVAGGKVEDAALAVGGAAVIHDTIASRACVRLKQQIAIHVEFAAGHVQRRGAHHAVLAGAHIDDGRAADGVLTGKHDMGRVAVKTTPGRSALHIDGAAGNGKVISGKQFAVDVHVDGAAGNVHALVCADVSGVMPEGAALAGQLHRAALNARGVDVHAGVRAAPVHGQRAALYGHVHAGRHAGLPVIVVMHEASAIAQRQRAAVNGQRCGGDVFAAALILIHNGVKEHADTFSFACAYGNRLPIPGGGRGIRRPGHARRAHGQRARQGQGAEQVQQAAFFKHRPIFIDKIADSALR